MRSGSMVGLEVPIIGSDAIKWLEIQIPSSSSSLAITGNTATSQQQHSFAPMTEDVSSYHIIGKPPAYLIWRIHKNQPNALELIEFSASEEFPKIGLRLIFQDALSPFAFICKSETRSNPYLLYTLTVSGIAYVIQLRNLCDYASCIIYPQNEFTEFDLKANSQPETTITSVAAVKGCLVVGRNDGSVGCFHLGILDPSAPGFVNELRDDAGIGRLWGLMSRGRAVGPVQAMVISDVQGRSLIFGLHADKTLRVWDLLGHTRVLNHTISIPESAGSTVLRFWAGDANPVTRLISIAILYRNDMEVDKDIIGVFNLRFIPGDKIILLMEPSMQNIYLGEGSLVDLKFAPSKLWILKDDWLESYDILNNDVNLEKVHSYGMQEAFVADQLLQVSEHSSDDLIWASNSLFSSVKDQVVPFVSSIFSRRLLHPGVHQNVTFRATIQDYNKYWTDSEFQSLSLDDLKQEMFSLIESEGSAENPISIVYCWKSFCARYFHYWCKNNRPYGLLVDTATDAVGLIRKSSLSLFRSLENVELLIYGAVDEFGHLVISGLDLPDDDSDREILFDVLRCISSINQQLGRAAPAIFYESLVGIPIISSEEVVLRLLKILETGYSSSVAAIQVSQVGADSTWLKELGDHKNQRKFSFDMLRSLHSLCNKAGTWTRVLNVIEHYLKFLVPCKSIQKLDSEVDLNISTSILVQSTSQVAKVMFESALDIHLLLGYLVNISAQVQMVGDDISRIEQELVPMVQEILMECLILHFLGTMPSRSPAPEDFSSQLSSLHIDSNADKKRWNQKLGTYDFTLASLLFLNFQSSAKDKVYLCSKYLPSPNKYINSVRNFISWIIWGGMGEESSGFCSHSTELAKILLRHGQFEAVESLIAMIDAHSRKEKTSQGVQTTDGDWCIRLHLLGLCLLARAQSGLQGIPKEVKVREAVRCFFRASSASGASEALQSLSFPGLLNPGHSDRESAAAWKLHYYQWAMGIFEQYNLSEGACQFCLAALEQVDEVIDFKDCTNSPLDDPAAMVRGRLWANVFKFTLDLSFYNDAYCAIISNPDEDSKNICLRRFIIVLCERGANKALCDGQLPFVGLAEKVEKELAWKAERSDIAAKPNAYKLLYAFEIRRHNWRKAASYMYRYSARLRSELALKENQQLSMALQETLYGLSAAINALNLVHPTYAWIDPQFDGYSCTDENHPNKKARTGIEESSLADKNVKSSCPQHCIDIEKLEKEFVLTSAQYLLTLANMKLKFKGNQTIPSELVDLLVQANFYDMAFTVLLKFWKGSELKRVLERIFAAISLKCCPSGLGSTFIGNDFKIHSLMLTSSEDESYVHGAIDATPLIHQLKGSDQWEILELYLIQYKNLHPRLPVIVAETLMCTDPQIELPLWLVHMFKGGKQATSWGMTGQESDAAFLFRLYVDYGRFTEATNLLLEYIQAFASLRPVDILKRKKMSAVWFPYTMIERLWCQLEEWKSSGHNSDQCDKLQKLLHGALLNHLKQIKVDSHDAVSSAHC
ncbi:hypothetical protein MKX01_011517 [Papaver californicum]|nr:hypothetical protein MKX01_011517 [Papaver californicum]